MPRVATRRRRHAIPYRFARMRQQCMCALRSFFLITNYHTAHTPFSVSEFSKAKRRVAIYCPSNICVEVVLSPGAASVNNMAVVLLAASNVVGLLVHAPSLTRDAGHAVRRSTQLQMGVVRKNDFEPPPVWCVPRLVCAHVRLVRGRATDESW